MDMVLFLLDEKGSKYTLWRAQLYSVKPGSRLSFLVHLYSSYTGTCTELTAPHPEEDLLSHDYQSGMLTSLAMTPNAVSEPQ